MQFEIGDKEITLAVFKNLRVFCRIKVCLSDVSPEGRTKITGMKHHRDFFDTREERFFSNIFSD